MKVALVGMPQSGKSTILAAISGKEGSAGHINEAVVPVPDERIDFLTQLYQPKKTVFATIDCLDLPGVSFVDDAGRAAARKTIAEAKAADMFVLVIRSFAEESVPAYRGSVDVRRDLAELQAEFLLADLELVTTRIERLQEALKKGSKNAEHDKAELALQLRLQEPLEDGKPARTIALDEKELELIKPLGLLTIKPISVLINTGEDELDRQFDVSGILDPSIPVFAMCAKLERELAQLDTASRAEFMADLALSEPGYIKFVNSCYDALGLISFLTVGPDEVRAWPVRRGSSALDAAGKIHTDIKRGFIRAETMAYEELKSLGGEKAVKAAGRLRLEGKTYIVHDGDIMHFRFNV
ncbi:MAG TPA: DUF933 domain-containing protein [Oligoflexia bacterium]|nr:DUF933 domain-containing protein [Oligoflexia bacterium]